MIHFIIESPRNLKVEHKLIELGWSFSANSECITVSIYTNDFAEGIELLRTLEKEISNENG